MNILPLIEQLFYIIFNMFIFNLFLKISRIIYQLWYSDMLITILKTMKNSIGQNIRRLRKGYGLTQEQFSEITGITRGQLKNWETDRHEPDLESLKIIASFFNVTTDTLLGFENEQNDPLLDLLLSDIQKDYNKLNGREQGKYAKQMAVYSKMLVQNKDLL